MKESIPLTWRRIPERYRLIGSICEVCNGRYFPRRTICPKCRRKGKVRDVQFSGKGKIYSYTVIYSAPSSFEDQVPYIIALVELDEGAKVLGQVVDCKPEDVKVGAEVESVFRMIQKDDPEGLIHYGFKFRLL
ncbi:MAG: Zn-ribbon domain-containing OB-fold protein [Candidatus Bilamarchaeaceae archaeon]